MVETPFLRDAVRPIHLGRQFARNGMALGAGFAFSAGVIFGVYLISLITGAELSDLTRDAIAVADTHLYYGVLSTLGLMLWAGTAAICLFGAAALIRAGADRDASAFLLLAGLLTTALTLDDGLLLHERVIPNWLGIPEPAVYLVYAASVASFLLVFMPRILDTDYVLLGVALVFMGLSVLIDALLPFSRGVTFVEDCSKFIGIVFWLGYFARSGQALLMSTMAPRPAAVPAAGAA